MSKAANLPSNNNLIIGLIGEIVRSLGGKTSDTTAALLFIVLCLAFLFAIATAPLKILLRKNFGQKAINSVEIILGAIFFSGCAYLPYYLSLNTTKDTHSNLYEAYFYSPLILNSIAIVLLSVALITLILGFREEAKNKFNHSGNWLADNYRGESILYGKYIKDPALQYKVWRRIEPAFCFKWSFFLLIIHPILGLPFLFSSIGFWINEFYHVKYKWEKIDSHTQEANTAGDSFAHQNMAS